jgi:hypothetical protein
MISDYSETINAVKTSFKVGSLNAKKLLEEN